MKLKISLFLLHLRCFPLDVPYAYFSGSEPLNLIEFRRNLAKELLDYSYQVCGRRGVHEGLCASTCGEETAPRFAGQVPSGRSLQQCTRSMSLRHTTARGASEIIADAKLGSGCVLHVL